MGHSSENPIDKTHIRHRTPATRQMGPPPIFLDVRGISRLYATRSNATLRNAIVNLVHGDAACVTLCHAARPYTFHGNPDRIRRTVGERNVSRILPSRLADPVLPWRQPGCSLSLPPRLPSSSSYPPAHLSSSTSLIYSLFLSLPFAASRSITMQKDNRYGEIRVHRARHR